MALVRAMRTYIKLSNSEMKKKPNRKNIISQPQVCLQSGGSPITRYDVLYAHLMFKLADKVRVNMKDTFQNIYIWFDSLKDFFLDNKIARIATEKDKLKGVEGELVFLESKTHRIINLDESEV